MCNEGEGPPDIDVGAFVSDREKLAEGSPVAKEIIETLGGYIAYRNEYDTTLVIDLGDYTDMYQVRQVIFIEIWWYEREDDMYVYPTGGAGPFCHKYFDALLTRSLTVGYVQTTMQVPTNPEGVLEAAYGSDWGSPYGSGRFYAHTDLGGCERFEGPPGGGLKATLTPALLGTGTLAPALLGTGTYTTRAAAAAACAAAGFAKGLCTQADLVGHSRCAAGWTSDWAGFWMAASSEGCGRRGYNPWSGPAGAYCCGPAEAGTDARELKSREAEQDIEFIGANWLY